MAETNLITIADVQQYRQIDPKINSVKFSSFCQEVQRKNLRNLLGDSLYYAFMLDARTSGIYKDLLDGKVYDNVQYYGIKPILCYWWLAIATREGDLFHSTVGAIQFTNNQQQSFETAKEKERIATGYMETAQGYANDCINFLNYYAASYPLWKSTTETNQVNFITFKV